MELVDIIGADNIHADLRVSSKKKLLLELANIGAGLTGLDCDDVFEALNSREQLGSTGVGHGVAIPHARFDGLEGIHGAFVRLASPVSFDSVDDQPVDLIFLLLAGDSSGASHLKTLARVSRLLRGERTRAAMRGANNSDALYSLIASPEADAA